MMGCLEEVASIRKKLDKIVSGESIDHSQATDLLGVLKKLPLTLEILTKTRIGIAVNSFRKASKDEKSIVLAKTLIKDWKRLLEKDKEKDSKQRSSDKVSDNNSASKDDSPNSSSQSPQSPSSTKHESSTKASYTTDTVRLKCREMIMKALQQDDFNNDFENMSGVLEDHIFKEFKNTGIKYKNRVRSRIYNLKDTKNPDLKQKVLEGLVTLERLAVMTSEEMASAEMKKLREKLTKEAIDDHQMAQQGGTKTGAFKCSKCGERDTSYNQLQTRSADEPMTTFVLCNCCGNRWKFC